MRQTLFRLLLPCWVILNLAACTKIVDANATQCLTDIDCQSFAGSVCDLRKQVCVPAPKVAGPIDASAPLDAGPIDTGMDTLVTNLDSAPTCKGGNGCYACAPATDQEYFSACTEATCVPFDNRTRLTNLASDGSLKPLP